MGWIFWQGVHSHVCNNGEFIFAGYPLWSVLCLLYPLSYSFLRILPPRPGLGTPSVSLFLNSFGPPSLSRLFLSSAPTFTPCTSPPSTFQPFLPISTFPLFLISSPPITLDLNRLVPLIPHALVCLSSSSYLHLSSNSSPYHAHTSYLHLSLETYRPPPAPVNLCRFDIL